MIFKSKRIDYTDRRYELDLTNLDRLPTDTGIPLIDRLNKELNAQSERLEDMFIEIACENMDNPRKCAFYRELSKGKKKKRKPIVEDDFNSDCEEYKAILEEVNDNPRD